MRHVHELLQTYFKIQGGGGITYLLCWMIFTIYFGMETDINMNTTDVQDTLEMALSRTGLDHAVVTHRPCLLSDNGSCYVSKALQYFLEHRYIEPMH